jgi:UDPglucose 6-dehydrogenase
MKIAVIGLGKLGLPLALLLSKRDHDVLGIDTNKSRITSIEDGVVENEPGLSALLKEVKRKNFEVTNEFDAKITECDLIFLILPTPSKNDHKFSSELVKKSILEIVSTKFKSSLIDICIVSTVNPGDSREIEKYILKSSINSETKFNLYYSPEFIALGTIIKNMENPDSILLGEHEVNSVGGNKIIKVLKTLALNEPKICRMSLTSAEITKIAINSFVTTKISFANFIGELADKFEDADKFSVLQSVGADSRIGEKYLRPGLGFGGPCFPRDNRAIAAMAKEVGVSADIAIATDKVNIRQPEIRANEISERFNFQPNKNILILGLSYKSGSYVVEESQAIMLANELNSRGFEVSVYDPISIDFATDKLSENIKHHKEGEGTEKFDLVIVAVTSPDFHSITSTISLEKIVEL